MEAPSRRERGFSVIHALGLLVFGGIVALLIFGETDSQKRERLNPVATRSLSNGDKFITGPALASGKRTSSLAEDSTMLDEIEMRLSENEKSLKTHYGSAGQLEQTQRDILKLAILKVDYLDNGKNEKEKALGKRALAVGKKVETQARQIYVSTLEEAFIKKGIDTRVTALGSDRNQMRISYALMSRPLVYKFQNELNLDEKAKSFGFKKLVYTNGLDGELGETWTIDIK